MKVKNVGSNMTEVETADGRCILVSYSTPVACISEKDGVMRTSKKWSVTTTKHINKWLQNKFHGGIVAREMGQEYFDNLV